MVIVCGGSYRRGKASCGDLDIVITHPDGTRYEAIVSHPFLKKTKKYMYSGIMMYTS